MVTADIRGILIPWSDALPDTIGWDQVVCGNRLRVVLESESHRPRFGAYVHEQCVCVCPCGSPTALWRNPGRFSRSQSFRHMFPSFASGLLRLCLYPASRFQTDGGHGLRIIRVVSRLFEIPLVRTCWGELRTRDDDEGTTAFITCINLEVSRDEGPELRSKAEKGDTEFWTGLTPLKEGLEMTDCSAVEINAVRDFGPESTHRPRALKAAGD